MRGEELIWISSSNLVGINNFAYLVKVASIDPVIENLQERVLQFVVVLRHHNFSPLDNVKLKVHGLHHFHDLKGWNAVHLFEIDFGLDLPCLNFNLGDEIIYFRFTLAAILFFHIAVANRLVMASFDCKLIKQASH